MLTQGAENIVAGIVPLRQLASRSHLNKSWVASLVVDVVDGPPIRHANFCCAGHVHSCHKESIRPALHTTNNTY